MNIGEISKPTVDRDRVSKKEKASNAEAVTQTHQVSDKVVLSDESKKRYEQEQSQQRQSDEKKENLAQADTPALKNPQNHKGRIVETTGSPTSKFDASESVESDAASIHFTA